MSATPQSGWIAGDVAEELPGLRLWSVVVAATPGPTTPGLRERLALLSSRFHGAHAVKLRTDPVPQAYRIFYRHVGLDPDTHRTPVEEAAMQRLVHGAFRSQGLIEDALLAAVAETGVPLWALDEATLSGELGIRAAGATESIGRGELADDAQPGRLVVADDAGPVAELFADPPRAHAPSRRTTRVRVYAVQVAGVPAIHVEEAFWQVTDALDSAAGRDYPPRHDGP